MEKLLFAGINQSDLLLVQWCYLAVALFVVFLAVTFLYIPLSEASDDDDEAMALQRLCNADLEQGVNAFGLNALHLLLWTGVALMWIYVGCNNVIHLVLLVNFRPGHRTRIQHVLGPSNQPRRDDLCPLPRSGSLLFWYPSTHHLSDLRNLCGKENYVVWKEGLTLALLLTRSNSPQLHGCCGLFARHLDRTRQPGCRSHPLHHL